MRKILKRPFFYRPTLIVAQALLGKFLVCTSTGTPRSLMLTDVEAYDGPADKASHASRGRTPRTAIMFGPGGMWYVYLVYGMHWMVNIVTGPAEYPAAVLLRGGKTDEGVRINGPARLTKFFGITASFNNTSATRATGLWMEDRGVRIARSRIQRSPRIGVAYAQEWALKPYRFFIL